MAAATTLNINNSGSGGTSSALGTGTFVINGGTINNSSAGAVALSTNNVQSWKWRLYLYRHAGARPGHRCGHPRANRIVTTTASTLTVGGAIGGSFSLTKAGAASSYWAAPRALIRAGP